MFNQCSICLDTINNMCSLNCNHFYCKNSIYDWLDNGKNTCPQCRERIITCETAEEKCKVITIEPIINTQENEHLLSIISNLKKHYKYTLLGITSLMLYIIYLQNKVDKFRLKYNNCSSEYNILEDHYTLQLQEWN